MQHATKTEFELFKHDERLIEAVWKACHWIIKSLYKSKTKFWKLLRDEQQYHNPGCNPPPLAERFLLKKSSSQNSLRLFDLVWTHIMFVSGVCICPEVFAFDNMCDANKRRHVHPSP